MKYSHRSYKRSQDTKEYWIYRQKVGAFAKRPKVFKEERLIQKKLGNQVK